MATAPTTAPAGSAPAKGANAAPAMVPFRCGTQNTTNLDGYSNTVTLSSTAAPSLPNYNPSVNSYLRGLWIVVTTASAVGASTFLPDAPYSFFAQISFLDTQQRPIVQVTGKQLACIR